jgi:hypothetical protein
MSSLMSSPASSPSFPHGQGFTACSGEYLCRTPSSYYVSQLIYRDIPLPLVTSGSENSGNLRELALNRMKDFGAECRDVRFREVGVTHFFPVIPVAVLRIRADTRDPPQSSTRVSRVVTQRLRRERRLGNVPFVRGPGARHPHWTSSVKKMLGRGDVSPRACAQTWGRRQHEYRAGAPCVWHGCASAWKRPNEVPAPGTQRTYTYVSRCRY